MVDGGKYDRLIDIAFELGKGLKGTNLNVFLRTLYNEVFKIREEFRRQPLCDYLYAPSETFGGDIYLEQLMEKYKEAQILSVFGLSFTEFIDLPRPTARSMVNVGNKSKAKESAEADELLKALGTKQ